MYKERGDKGMIGFFFILIHFNTGAEHVVATFVPNNKPEIDDPAYICWKKFMEGDCDFKNSRFKIIPNVVEGPWIVKKAVGASPVPTIIGNKISCHWGEDRDMKVIEFLCDIQSSITATTILGVVKGACKSVVIDLAFVVEGQEFEELPERILGVIRLSRVNITEIRSL